MINRSQIINRKHMINIILLLIFILIVLPCLIGHYSINEKVNLKIKNTNFEENFDVSSIKSVLESAVIQCYVKSLYESL